MIQTAVRRNHNRRLKDRREQKVKDGWQSGAIAAVLRTSQQGEQIAKLSANEW